MLLTTGNAWDCVFLHVMNNFFAMFVRSDRAPDLGDPIMMVMFGGSIVAYSTLSLCAWSPPSVLGAVRGIRLIILVADLKLVATTETKMKMKI